MDPLINVLAISVARSFAIAANGLKLNIEETLRIYGKTICLGSFLFLKKRINCSMFYDGRSVYLAI